MTPWCTGEGAAAFFFLSFLERSPSSSSWRKPTRLVSCWLQKLRLSTSCSSLRTPCSLSLSASLSSAFLDCSSETAFLSTWAWARSFEYSYASFWYLAGSAPSGEEPSSIGAGSGPL
uniref:Uncharacterized protein n=1 Tax=Ixodes ricinus TaxID=34613 RepID=A0A6B0ULJ4_IXORI